MTLRRLDTITNDPTAQPVWIDDVSGAISAGPASSPTVLPILQQPHLNDFHSLLSNVKIITVPPFKVSATPGHNPFYTVPAGKRAIIDVMTWCPNSTVSDNSYVEMKPAGYTGWFFISPFNGAPGASSNPASRNPTALGSNNSTAFPIFEAGDVLSVASTQNQTTWVSATIWLFDNTSPLRSIRYFLELGQTLPIETLLTLYTVPPGKSAFLLDMQIGNPCCFNNAMQGCGAFSYHLYTVPNGAAGPLPEYMVAASNLQQLNAAPQANNPGAATVRLPGMSAGDKLQMRVLPPSTYNVTSIGSVTGTQCNLNGTFSNGAANALAGLIVYLDGWTNGGNNGEFTVLSSTTTVIVLQGTTFVGEQRSTSIAVVGFTLSAAANASGGLTGYTGIFGANAVSNGLQGGLMTIAGFTNPANNGTFVVTGNSATALNVQNPNGVAETHAATARWAGPRTNLDIGTNVPGSLAFWFNFVQEF